MSTTLSISQIPLEPIYRDGNMTLVWQNFFIGLYSRTGGTISNVVTTDTNQLITGTKTFSSLISGNISGNASTATIATSVITNANLTGPITSIGNTTSINSKTGTGNTFVMSAGAVTLTGTLLLPLNSLTLGTNQLVTSSGNVGIGTATPSEKLTIVGNNKITGNLLLTGDITQTGNNNITGNLSLTSVGNKIKIKEGANASMGTAILVAGTIVVNNTLVTANSRILLTSQVDGGVVGFQRITNITAATSFTITSSSITDTSTIAWLIVEPN